jgi:hypothetical protein
MGAAIQKLGQPYPINLPTEVPTDVPAKKDSKPYIRAIINQIGLSRNIFL